MWFPRLPLCSAPQRSNADTMQPTMETPTTIDHRVEMFQRGGQTDSFFNMKALAPRPMSTATVFDIDYEDDDNSEIEDDSPISPRFSLNSVG